MTLVFVKEHWFVFALLFAYSCLLLYHAKIGFRQTGEISGFLAGGRGQTGLIIGISFAATFASSNSYLGLSGKGYEYGLPWLLFACMIVVFAYLSWKFVAPGMRRFGEIADAVTIPEYFASRFDSELCRVVAGLIVFASSILYLVAIFKGSAHLFQTFLEVPYTTAVGIMLVVVLVYTSVGGFVSVVRTDVWQGGLMVVGSVLLFVFITDAAGGVGSILEFRSNPSKEWIFSFEGAAPLVILGIALAGSMKLLIDPRQLSRFYGLRDQKAVERGMYWAVAGLLIIQFSLFPLGIYAHHLLPGVTDTDLIVPTLIQDPAIFSLLVSDFLVVAVLSAAMSSMDSVLLVSGSSIVRDVIQPVSKLSLRHDVFLTRIGIIASAFIAALIALDPFGGIVEITTFSGSLYAACFGPAILFGLHRRSGDAQSVLYSMAVGVTVLLVWRFLGFSVVIHEVLPAIACSGAVYLVVAKQNSAVETLVVCEYFEHSEATK